jgi:hypothetical protein
MTAQQASSLRYITMQRYSFVKYLPAMQATDRKIPLMILFCLLKESWHADYSGEPIDAPTMYLRANGIPPPAGMQSTGDFTPRRSSARAQTRRPVP